MGVVRQSSHSTDSRGSHHAFQPSGSTGTTPAQALPRVGFPIPPPWDPHVLWGWTLHSNIHQLGSHQQMPFGVQTHRPALHSKHITEATTLCSLSSSQLCWEHLNEQASANTRSSSCLSPGTTRLLVLNFSCTRFYCINLPKYISETLFLVI